LTVFFLSIAGLSLTANADSITQTFFYATPEAPSAVPWTDYINLSKINILGGTLLDVKLQVGTDWNSSINVTNIGNATNTVQKAGTELEMSLYGTSTNFNNTFGVNGTNSYLIDKIIGHVSGTFSLNPGGNTNFTAQATTKAANQYYYASDYDLSEFMGIGNLPLTVAATSFTDYGGSGSGQETESSAADLTMKVIYDYSGTFVPQPISVPEPSAGMLLGVGGLICWGWRRKAVRKA